MYGIQYKMSQLKWKRLQYLPQHFEISWQMRFFKIFSIISIITKWLIIINSFKFMFLKLYRKGSYYKQLWVYIFTVLIEILNGLIRILIIIKEINMNVLQYFKPMVITKLKVSILLSMPPALWHVKIYRIIKPLKKLLIE